MIDTLLLMRLVDKLGQSTHLDDVCRLVVSSKALGYPLAAASLLVRDDQGVLQERGRYQLPGSPADFANLALTFPTPLALALASPQSSTVTLGAAHSLHPDISYPLESSPFASVWLLPLSSAGEPIGVLMAFSPPRAVPPALEISHEKLLASGLTLAVRQNSWRYRSQPTHPRLAG
ncbi:MAG: GAF domain-containing protein [Pontimonas sp.]